MSRQAQARSPSAELLPVAYYHVMFTVPAQIADIAFHIKAVIYDIPVQGHV